jgi:hypothetical protein
MTNPPVPDAAVVADLAGQIDKAAAESIVAEDVPQHLQIPEGPSSLRNLAIAFQYYSPGLGRRGAGEPHFRPQFTFGMESFPPSLDKLVPEDRALWEATAEVVTEPVARARLHDMCFEAKWGNRDHHARQAIDGYLATASRDIPDTDPGRITAPLGRAKALARALELAKLVGAGDLADAAMKAAARAAADELEGDDPILGSTLGLVDVLIDGDEDVVIIKQLLVRAREVFDSNHWGTVKTIELQLKLSGPDETRRKELHREQVQSGIDNAHRMMGAARMGLLDQTANEARNFGIGDLFDQIVAEMQSIRFEDLGMIRRTYTVSILEESMELHLSQFTDAPSWQEALQCVCVRAPSGDVSSNRAATGALATRFPLLSVMPVAHVGDDAMTRIVSSTDEEKEEAQLSGEEMRQLNVQGTITALTFARIWQKWGPIPEDDLAAFFEGSHVDRELATALAHDFLRYFTGDPDGAAYTGAARAEALARSLALAINLPIFRPQQGKKPGQYDGLGAILPELHKQRLDESWYRFLYSFLVSPTGANARNKILHGLVNQVSEPIAALVLTGALFLAKGVAVVHVDPSEADT